MRRVVYGIAAPVIAGALWFGLSKPESIGAGHNPTSNASCSGVSAGGSHFPAGSTVTINLTGAPSKTFTWSDQVSTVETISVANPNPAVSHPYLVHWESDTPIADVKGVIAPCTPTTTPGSSATATSNASSTAPTPTTPATVPSTRTSTSSTLAPSTAPGSVPASSTSFASTPSTASPTTAPPVPPSTSSSVPLQSLPASPPVESVPPTSSAPIPTFPGGLLPPTCLVKGCKP